MKEQHEKNLKKLIKEEISKLKDKEDEYLVHIYKVILSIDSKKDKVLYEPLKKAIEKERKERGTKEIDSKGVAINESKAKSSKPTKLTKPTKRKRG